MGTYYLNCPVLKLAVPCARVADIAKAKAPSYPASGGGMLDLHLLDRSLTAKCSTRELDMPAGY